MQLYHETNTSNDHEEKTELENYCVEAITRGAQTMCKMAETLEERYKDIKKERAQHKAKNVIEESTNEDDDKILKYLQEIKVVLEILSKKEVIALTSGAISFLVKYNGYIGMMLMVIGDICALYYFESETKSTMRYVAQLHYYMEKSCLNKRYLAM